MLPARRSRCNKPPFNWLRQRPRKWRAHGDALKIRLAAPPVDGKANAALIDFVANFLKIPKSRVDIKSGHSARRKVLEIDGSSAAQIHSLLSEQ